MLHFTPQSRNLILVLSIIVAYLLGVTTGKSIININNHIKESSPITSKKAEQPTQKAATTFKTINECNTSFLLPSSYTKTHTKPPRYSLNDSFVDIDCEKLLRFGTTTVATASATIAGQNTEILRSQNNLIWSVKSSTPATSSASITVFHTTSDIAPLVQRTLELDEL